MQSYYLKLSYLLPTQKKGFEAQTVDAVCLFCFPFTLKVAKT